jgi:hypothetical protein
MERMAMNTFFSFAQKRTQRNFCRLLIFGFLLTMLCGCASIRSYTLDQTEIADKKRAGMTYYLPIRYADVMFERRLLLTKPEKSISDSKAEQDKAEKKAKEAKVALDEASFRVAQIRSSGVPAGSGTFQKLVLAEIEAKLALAAAEKLLAEARMAHTKAVADHHAWESAKTKCGYIDRFSITLHKPVADTRYRFSMHMAHSIFRKDKWVYTTTADGLLSTVQGTVTDQTAEILVAAARSAVATEESLLLQTYALDKDRKNLIRALQAVKPAHDQNDPCHLDWKPLLIQRTFDPAVKAKWAEYFDEVNAVANVGCKQKVPCNQQLGSFNYALSADFKEAPEVATSPNTPADGLYYRRELPMLVRIEERGKFAGAFMLTLPNPSPMEFMPLRNSPMVTTQHTIGFDRGILVSVDSERPSELLRAVAIPWDIATAVIGASTDLVKFRVDYAKGNTDLVREQTRLLEELREQLDAQHELDAARTGGGEDDDADP